MKRIVRLTILGFCTFLISGCYFDEINQPDNAQQNENIQIVLNIHTMKGFGQNVQTMSFNLLILI